MGAAETRKLRIVAVMPAYNAEATLERTVRGLPAGAVDEVILVDDASRDRTVEVARALGLTVIVHERNRGYGANQKTCYDQALARGADIVLMLHPDDQYDSRLVPCFTGFVASGTCDVMLGCRVRTRRETLRGGMPVWKYLSNRMLTLIENVVLGQNLGDGHSGFRVYARAVLETIPYHANADGFVFDSQFLAQVAWFGFRMGDAPVPCRYERESSSIGFLRSLHYGIGTLLVLAQFLLQRLRLGRFAIFRPRPPAAAAKPLAPQGVRSRGGT